MEQRSSQENTALLDVAYVVCYGHFPNPDTSDNATRPQKDIKPHAVNGNEATTPVTPPNSPLDGGNPFPEDKNSLSEDGNPFSEDGNPFPEEGNPFSEDGNEEEDDQNPFKDDSNPFKDDDESKDVPVSQDTSQESPSSTAPPGSVDETSSSPQPSAASEPSASTQSEPEIPIVTAQVAPKSKIDPNSPLAAAMGLKDGIKVSQSHAKEIISEAFNVTKLDFNRLVEDTRESKASPTVELLLEEIRTEGLPVSPTPEMRQLHESTTLASNDTYPILFLRARVGQEDRFTNFSSTSATNTIQQSLTLGIQNMYKDTLSLEVWSANVLPPEDPQTPPKLDFLGRIMTGSMRLKKGDSRYGRTMKVLKDSAEEEHHVDNEKDTSLDISRQTPSPEATDGQATEATNSVAKDNSLQNGEAAQHEDLSHSLDISDSMSVGSEMSNDPLRTSTPRGRSSSMQHLEATNLGDGSQKKKGFRSSFRQKANHFMRSSHSNLRKSNQNLSAESSSPSLSRRAPDTHSIQSESSDISSYDNLDGDTSKDAVKKGKLDRETSRSTLSITSFTRRTFSMRLSTKKATNPIKKFGSMRVKKNKDLPVPGVIAPSQDTQQQIPDIHLQSPVSQNDSPSPTDAADTSVGDQVSLSQHSMESIDFPSPKTAPRKPLTPRPMRPFKNLKINLKIKGDHKDEPKDGSPTAKSPTEKIMKIRTPNNPENIQKYLSGIGKDHLQAERLAYATVPIKGIVGEWVKEGWIPMTLTDAKVSNVTTNITKKKKKGNKTSDGDKTIVIEKDAKVLCRMHVRLALPVPRESELHTSAFDSYNFTYSKLVNLQVQTMSDLTDYKGTVGVVGDIVLSQLVFFSRVSVCHQKLVSWLVLAEKKPSDSTLLLPLLTAIGAGLHESKYVTAQKLKMGESLSKWVKCVIAKEFEMLHSSFPCSSHVLHLPRLEHFLRCFNTIEEDSELRILFEREMNLIHLPSLTDQLKGALVKNSEIWIEALNKEPVNQETSLNVEAADSSADDTKWHDALRRAAHLTKPIDAFLVICVHTYQPIFMTEMSVDYLYWVMPSFLTAALHLINKTHRFTLTKIKNLPKAYISSAAQAAWKICSNISSINKIGVDSQLPIHLIEKNFRTAYSNTVLQWLTLSEMLSLEELENDLQVDEFVAVDPVKGYSHSAVSMVDILKAIMSRLRGLCWPGGLKPGVNTLTRIAKQIVSLVIEYTNRVTHIYTARGGHTDRIPTQVCVVVRNVEHVCDEARQHLGQLASWAEEGLQVQEELPPEEESNGVELKPEGRNHQLQRQIDYTAETLLQRCLPKLEQILTQGVSRDSTDFILRSLETALQPIEDRLYFAEPLLYELWNRLFQHTVHLKKNYMQGQWRHDLQRLQKALTCVYTFLTDSQKVGFQLPAQDVQEYEDLIEDLKMQGASSAGLVAKYYNERYNEQCKEIGSKTTPVIVANVTFSKEGLRVYIVQAPGNTRGALVKVRMEPQQWFPHSIPLKTRLVKAEQAVFDETLHFYEVKHDGPLEETEESIGVGGIVILQIRTPKLFMGSAVHYEAIVPLATIPIVTEEKRNTIQHLRLPLTRPWSFTNYKALETLKVRIQDQSAMSFLKALQTRWEGNDDSTHGQDSLKVNSNFLRAGSLRLSGMGSRRRASLRDTTVK